MLSNQFNFGTEPHVSVKQIISMLRSITVCFSNHLLNHGYPRTEQSCQWTAYE